MPRHFGAGAVVNVSDEDEGSSSDGGQLTLHRADRKPLGRGLDGAADEPDAFRAIRRAQELYQLRQGLLEPSGRLPTDLPPGRGAAERLGRILAGLEINA